MTTVLIRVLIVMIYDSFGCICHEKVAVIHISFLLPLSIFSFICLFVCNNLLPNRFSCILVDTFQFLFASVNNTATHYRTINCINIYMKVQQLTDGRVISLLYMQPHEGVWLYDKEK